MHDDEEGRIEAFNDAVMRWMIVRGTCDPNDIRLNAPIFEGSEENVRSALTSNAIRFLWDRIERFHISKSPLVPEIKDDEIEKLIEYLKKPIIFVALTTPRSIRVRKLLGFVLEELQTIDPTYKAPAEEDEDLPLL
jgi:hypothetical protein